MHGRDNQTPLLKLATPGAVTTRHGSTAEVTHTDLIQDKSSFHDESTPRALTPARRFCCSTSVANRESHASLRSDDTLVHQGPQGAAQ